MYCVEQLAGAKGGPTNGPKNKSDGGGATGNGQSQDPADNGRSGKSAEKKD